MTGIAAKDRLKIAGLGESARNRNRQDERDGHSWGDQKGAQGTAGAYVSDVALGRRDLTPDGFTGAMGKGAFYGGVAGGGAVSRPPSGLNAAAGCFAHGGRGDAPEAVAAAQGAAQRGPR